MCIYINVHAASALCMYLRQTDISIVLESVATSGLPAQIIDKYMTVTSSPKELAMLNRICKLDVGNQISRKCLQLKSFHDNHIHYVAPP